MIKREEYQYFVLLEVSNGNEIVHKDINPFDGIKYRHEITKCFYKKVLEYSTQKIGLIDLKFNGLFQNDVRNEIHGMNHINSLISLIIIYSGNENLAKQNILPPNEVEYDREKLPDPILKSFKRNEFYSSYWALFHFLVNNDERFLEDLFFVNKTIKHFYEHYLYPNKIRFLQAQINNDNSNGISTLYEPSIIQPIQECIINNSKLSTFFLNEIQWYKEQDLYVNYGLGEFEGGEDVGYDWKQDCHLWDKPSKSESREMWTKKEDIWNKAFIESIKKISKDESKSIIFKVSYDQRFSSKKIVLKIK